MIVPSPREHSVASALAMIESPARRASAPHCRAVVLGASNLTRGISTVVEVAERQLGAPLELFAALGHGRSFGLRTNVLGRELPGILQSGLWDALARRQPLPTAALITDVGNDLLYHVPVATIVQWVRQCIERLLKLDARPILTLPPVCNLPDITPLRYYVLRTVLYRRCRLSFYEAQSGAARLEEGLRTLGAEYQLPTVSMQASWYGLDPIHIRLRQWRAAWPAILAAWRVERLAAGACAAPEEDAGKAAAVPPSPKGSLARWLHLRTCLPAETSTFGVVRRAAQPCATLPSGTQVWMY